MTSHLLNIAGTKIEVREYGSDKKPALLAIQGWGNTLERADEFIRILMRSFHLYTLILPGYGKSPATTRAQDVAFVADLIDPICKKLKIEPHFLGYSLGSIILSAYLKKHPAKGKRIFYVGPPMQTTPKPLAVRLASLPYVRSLVRRSSLLSTFIIGATKNSVKKLSRPKKRKLWMSPVHEATPEGLFDSLLAALNTFPDPRTLGLDIDYIYGKDDLLQPLKDVPEKLTIVPGAGHLIMFEQPELLAQTIRKLMGRRTS